MLHWVPLHNSSYTHSSPQAMVKSSHFLSRWLSQVWVTSPHFTHTLELSLLQFALQYLCVCYFKCYEKFTSTQLAMISGVAMVVLAVAAAVGAWVHHWAFSGMVQQMLVGKLMRIAWCNNLRMLLPLLTVFTHSLGAASNLQSYPDLCRVLI